MPLPLFRRSNMKNLFIEYGDTVIQFPVNPEDIKIKSSSGNETQEVVKLGEVSTLRDSKLASLEFSSFFPVQNDGSPYILTKNRFRDPDFYLDFLIKIRDAHKPCRFLISDTKINMVVSIEDFEYGFESGDVDVYYSLGLKQYREVRVREVNISDYQSTRPKYTPPPPPPPPRPAPASKQVTIGCTVILNGQLHRDSYGAGPGQTRSNFQGKINFINLKGSHPYHVTTMDGGWQGWVLASCVQVV